MENSYLQTSGFFVDDSQAADSQVKEAGSNLRALIIPVAIGTSIAVAGIFIVLAAVQVLPHGVNAISSCGTWGYVAGVVVISGGVITVVIGLVVYFRHKAVKEVGTSNITTKIAHKDDNSNRIKTQKIRSDIPITEKTIGNQELEHFRTYKKGEDKAYAYALDASFFYYDCDDVKDYEWGCAWRCIQICASAVNLFPKFKELYVKYRLDSKSQKEWAEPGYGKRYLDDEGIPNQLILYNKESGTSKTPTEWCEKINGFPALRDKLVAHFNRYATPVMADDVTFAMTIVGIRVTALDETILFIADPHKINRESGLYYIVLDNEGNQIATTGVDNGKNGLSTVKSAYFNKGWMLLFPQPERD